MKTPKTKPRRSLKRVVRARVNHLYRDIPAKLGSVAECGHVKNINRGFMDDAGTCNACVQAVIGPRLKAQRPNAELSDSRP